NLIGTNARLVFSVKCNSPSRLFVSKPERTKSSTATFGSSGLTIIRARFVPIPLVSVRRGLVKLIVLVSQNTPLVTQVKPFVNVNTLFPAVVRIWTELVTGQSSTFVPYLPRLVAL